MTEPAVNLDPVDPNPQDPPADPNPNPSDPPADPKPEPFKWPDNWRQQIASGLAGSNKDLVGKYQKQLEQFLDPIAVYKQNVELRRKMDSGELKKALPDKATPEDIAAYRKANGIPETPDKYDIKPEGVWAEESNKERLNDVLKFAHENNLPPQAAKSMLDFMAKGHQSALDALAERDEKERSETEESLRAEWGQDYKPNMNLLSSLLDGEEEGFKEDLFNARLPDGSKLINDVGFNKLLVRLAREINPVGAIMPSGTTDAKSIDDEIDSLRKLQASDPKEFWGEKVQKRLLELQGAKERISKKA